MFIHSQSGLGKTHLLNAIGNYSKKRNSSLKILYTTSEDFVNEYIKSIKENTVDNFNFKFLTRKGLVKWLKRKKIQD